LFVIVAIWIFFFVVTLEELEGLRLTTGAESRNEHHGLQPPPFLSSPLRRAAKRGGGGDLMVLVEDEAEIVP